MSVQVIVDTKKLRDKINKSSIKRAQKELANKVMIDSDLFVPLRTGALRLSATIALDGSAIVYHSDYAIYQYMKHYSRYTTRGTGPRWDEEAGKVHMKDWEDTVVRGLGL